jgi:hypothetical protein
VLTVGVLSVLDGDLFPDQTVWSDFGAGYVFIPLVLPLVGLAWLRKAVAGPGGGAGPGAADGQSKAPRTHTTRGRDH